MDTLKNSRDSARKINGQIMDDSFLAEMGRSVPNVSYDELMFHKQEKSKI